MPFSSYCTCHDKNNITQHFQWVKVSEGLMWDPWLSGSMHVSHKFLYFVKMQSLK